MPLSPPAPRKLMHNRDIQCRGYEREDGLWDIEGHLIDCKPYPVELTHSGRKLVPNEPVHHMWLRLTVDLDMVIHDAEAVTDSGPYNHCGNITPNFKGLKGIVIGPGWRKKIREVVGGIKGCTHLVELLGPVGTTAYQTTGRARARRAAGIVSTKKPSLMNSCHVYDETKPLARTRWPQYFASGSSD